MEPGRLERQMQFILEIDRLKSVLRRNYLSDGSRRENDTEHSWHLAMMVMVLSEYFEGADLLKTIKMVLIHDLVEIYAGDTFAYDEQAHGDKEERETRAAEKLFSLLPEDQAEEYRSLWQEFERAESAEALCAATVDRVEPLLLNSSSQGKMWKEYGITAEQVYNRNRLVFERAPRVIAEYVGRMIEDASKKGYFRKE